MIETEKHHRPALGDADLGGRQAHHGRQDALEHQAMHVAWVHPWRGGLDAADQGAAVAELQRPALQGLRDLAKVIDRHPRRRQQDHHHEGHHLADQEAGQHQAHQLQGDGRARRGGAWRRFQGHAAGGLMPRAGRLGR